MASTTTDPSDASGVAGGGAAANVNNNNNNNNNTTNVVDIQEAKLLVKEFPPPPFYYRRAAAASASAAGGTLKPPRIPTAALERGTRKAAAAAAAARSRAEAERVRLEMITTTDHTSGNDDGDKTANVLGAVGTVGANAQDQDDLDDEDGDVVGVFGEVVEDCLLVQPLDSCDDPAVIRDEVKRLNRMVLQNFVALTRDLVSRPGENKKSRDELSHNIFLMLQETNKFREHQSRELLIELLEQQLQERRKLAEDLEAKVARADALLARRTDDER